MASAAAQAGAPLVRAGAGRGGTRQIPRTFSAVPAAVGAVNPATGYCGGCRGDGALLPQPLRSGGDPQNPRRGPGAAAQADCRPVADGAGAVGYYRRGDRAAV